MCITMALRNRRKRFQKITMAATNRIKEMSWYYNLFCVSITKYLRLSNAWRKGCLAYGLGRGSLQVEQRLLGEVLWGVVWGGRQHVVRQQAKRRGSTWVFKKNVCWEFTRFPWDLSVPSNGAIPNDLITSHLYFLKVPSLLMMPHWGPNF